MQLVHTIADTRAAVAAARRQGRSIGLVPTMGALHAGHRALIEAAKAECGFVAVSIFVNPAQFAPDEDFDAYPRTLDADAALCRGAGVDLLFVPTAAEMYPRGFQTCVEVERLSEPMCGASRPGHFRGVCTVVTKLFHIVAPDVAFFGQKDYQQAAILRRMAEDLDFDLRIVTCPTVREPDGLAMSSRNRRLSGPQRTRAVALSRALFAARDAVAAGERDADMLRLKLLKALQETFGKRIDYAAVVDPQTLEDVPRIDGPVLLAAAVHVGNVRLIDNVVAEPGGV